jgi:hypothetical protein
MRTRAVAPATTWHRDQVVCGVFVSYCCVKTIWIVGNLCLLV